MNPGPKPQVLQDFVEDLISLRSAGYTTRQDYADRLCITLSCLDQRVYRARRSGLLPPAPKFSPPFLPFGDLS